jgi:hypothetical protein
LMVGAPSAPGAQGTVLQVSVPIPEFTNPSLSIALVLISTLGIITIRRRKVR